LPLLKNLLKKDNYFLLL